MHVAIRILFLVLAAGASSTEVAQAQIVYLPGIEIPSLTTAQAGQIDARERATHFVRHDDDPPVILFDGRKLPASFPADLTPARGRRSLMEFARLAPRMKCRTDDVADAYVFLMEAAMFAYNGTRFLTLDSKPDFSCGNSFGAIGLSQKVHVYLGSPQFAAVPNGDKQRLYETLVAIGGYLLDNAQHAKPGSAEQVKAHADAADVIRSLVGTRAERVHLGGLGIKIDDQLRP